MEGVHEPGETGPADEEMQEHQGQRDSEQQTAEARGEKTQRTGERGPAIDELAPGEHAHRGQGPVDPGLEAKDVGEPEERAGRNLGLGQGRDQRHEAQGHEDQGSELLEGERRAAPPASFEGECQHQGNAGGEA